MYTAQGNNQLHVDARGAKLPERETDTTGANSKFSPRASSHERRHPDPTFCFSAFDVVRELAEDELSMQHDDAFGRLSAPQCQNASPNLLKQGC